MAEQRQDAFYTIVILDAARSAPSAFLKLSKEQYDRLLARALIYPCGGDPGDAEGDAFNHPGVILLDLAVSLARK